MSIVDRHKKPGGFRKLVNSLETTSMDKREKILDVLRKEDAQFVDDVEKSIFNFEDFINLNDMVVCEIIANFIGEPRTLALALYKTEEKNPALFEKFKKNMTAKDFSGFKDATSVLEAVRLNEQIGARFRIVQKSRELERSNKFNLKKYAGNYRDE